jgi:hypothetical protein
VGAPVHPSIHRSRVTSPPEPVTLADFPDPGFSKAGSDLGRRRDTAHRIDEFVDLLVGVVGGERGTHSLLQAQSPQDRLRTAVTRARHDALLVQSLTDLDRVAPGKHERQDTRLVVSGAHQAQPGNVREPWRPRQRRGSDRPFTRAWPKCQAGTGTSSSCGYRTLTEHAEAGDAVKARAEPDRLGPEALEARDVAVGVSPRVTMGLVVRWS